MLAALFLGYKRIWVFGSYYMDAIRDRDEWKAIALRAMGSTHEVAQAAKKHTTFTPEEAEMARRIVAEAGRKLDELDQ